jgi:hypothetical protein
LAQIGRDELIGDLRGPLGPRALPGGVLAYLACDAADGVDGAACNCGVQLCGKQDGGERLTSDAVTTEMGEIGAAVFCTSEG